MSVRNVSGPPPEELTNLMELTALELERRAERLLKLSRDLLAQASLHATLIALPEERTVNRRGDVVTEAEAIKTARELGNFTRAQFAEALGLRPASVSRWLAKLLDREHPIIVRHVEGGYSYLTPTSSSKAPVKQIEVERTLITDPSIRTDQVADVNARKRKIRQQSMSVSGQGHQIRQREKRRAVVEQARRERRTKS